MRKYLSFFTVLVLTLLSFSLSAQDVTGVVKSEDQTVKKQRRSGSSEIVVKGDLFDASDSAYTVNVVDSDKIKEMGISRTADILQAIPGIVITNYGQGLVSNAVTLRGFSSGVHGDDMGIYIDGIPLNEVMGHGGGYADPNIIIPLEIEKVNFYKGPSTALYGNFSKAGTMAIYSRKKGEYNDMSLKYGSFNTTDVQVATGEKISDNMWNNTAVQFYRTDGYIENTSTLLGNASTKFIYDPTKDLEITLSLRAHSSEWDDSGYIPLSQFQDKSQAYKQRPNAEDNGGNRRQFCERLDAGYIVNENIKVNVWGFGSETNWSRWSKGVTASTQTEDTYSIYKAGAGTNINYNDSFLKFIVGAEFYSDGTDYQGYSTINRVRQSKSTDYKERLDNYVLLAEGEINLHPLFRPTIGVRADAFQGDYKDRITGEHDTFGFSKYDHISPKIGFRSTVIDRILDFRASICNGYAIAKSTVIFRDTMIKPSDLWQYEIGTTVKNRDMFSFDAAAFILDTKNEINPDPLAPSDPTKYINEGATRRIGAETSAMLKPLRGLEFNGKFSWISTDIKSNPDPTKVGKSLTGIPVYSAQAGIKGELPGGQGMKAEWIYVGKEYLDALNTTTYNGYNLLNIGVFYNIVQKNNNITLAFDVKNVFNKLYAGFASASQYSPGEPRSYTASINMKW